MIVVLIVSALVLVMRDENYRPSFSTIVAQIAALEQSFPSVMGGLTAMITSEENVRLAQLTLWSLWQVFTYAVIPALVVRIVLRKRLRDFGAKVRGMTSGWWVYVVMFVVIMPAVLWASTTESFQRTYPFFKPSADGSPTVLTDAYWSRFWIWQVLYGLQFVSLEFFFRGFMLHGTRARLGPYSILVMMVPYCMIHFGKPLPETIGAIIAGTVLGFMSLKTRSVWLGAVLHIAVALTMDLLAIGQLS